MNYTYVYLPFQAEWHPLVDTIVAGRYPDPKLEGYVEDEPRSNDIIDADSGDIIAKLTDPGIKGIISVSDIFIRLLSRLRNVNSFYKLDS